MAHQDAELSDVVVVLVDEPGMTTEDAANKLRDLGLAVSDVNENDAVVQGTIETDRIKSLKALKFVKYVRNVFNYMADYPPGDAESGPG